jgi:putative RecB family exonuclease
MGDVSPTTAPTLLDPVVDLPVDDPVDDPVDGGEAGGRGPARLSPSSAALWAQCPRRWWYRYVDRLPEPPPGEAMVLGSFVHRILELLLDEPPARRSPDTARALARQVWDDELEGSPEWASLGLDEASGRRFRQRAWVTVEAYFSCQSPAEVHPVARELEVEAEVEGVPFRGFVDLLEVQEVDGDRHVVVTDYKTGQAPRRGTPFTEAQVAEKLLQPRWYAAAIEALGEHRPSRARLLYFSAVPSPRGLRMVTDELTTPVDGPSLAPARAELRRRWDAIGDALEAGGAEPNPGPLCGWCPYVELCGEGEHECRSRWEQRNEFTGGRRLREDAPAVELLGLVAAGQPTSS